MIIVTGGIGTTGKVLRVNDAQVSELLSFPDNEVYGITKANGHYYVSLRAGQPKVVMLDSSLKVLCHSRLPSTADPHCIFVENNIVHLVSSSEDLVYKFTLGLDFVGRDVFGLGGDKRFHVNDVARIGSEFFVSMFTDKADGKWNEDIGDACPRWAAGN